MNFLDIKDKKLSSEFKKKGYLIIKSEDINSLNYIKKSITAEIKKNIKIKT